MSEPESDRPTIESTEVSGGIAIVAGVIAQVLANGGGTFSFSFQPGAQIEDFAEVSDEGGGVNHIAGQGTLASTGRATDLSGGADTRAARPGEPRPCEGVFGLGTSVRFYGGPFTALRGHVRGVTTYMDREPAYIIRPDAEAAERLGHYRDVVCDQRQVRRSAAEPYCASSPQLA